LSEIKRFKDIIKTFLISRVLV